MEMSGVEFEGNPFWDKVAPAATRFDSLKGIHEAEIAIVGGGIAGLSLAYHLLTEAKITPIVVEAATPGGDATGKSAGIIASLSVRHSPYEILTKYGDDNGRRLLFLLGESGKYVFSLIRELALDCAPQQTGFLGPAKTTGEVYRVNKIASEWRASGYGIQVIDRERIRYLSGLDAYRGALLDPAGGAINPLAYARELARVTANLGAKLFIDSPVTKVFKNGNGWRLESGEGRINAKKVVFCAGGGNRGLYGELAHTVLPFKVYQVATEPLDAKIRSIILPENHALTDVHSNIFSIRYDKGGRLITACPGFIFNNTSHRVISFVEERLKRFSPLLNATRIQHIWRGTTWIGKSLLPRFIKLSEGLFAVQACNGRGLAINTILGRETARFIKSGCADKLNLLVEKPDAVRYYSLISHLPVILMNTARLRSQVMYKLTGLHQYR